MNVKQIIQALQTMIDIGVITGEEKFGVYECHEYPPNEDSCLFSPNKFKTFVDEFTEETIVYF